VYQCGVPTVHKPSFLFSMESPKGTKWIDGWTRLGEKGGEGGCLFFLSMLDEKKKKGGFLLCCFVPPFLFLVPL
jgi:hypothetical protein